jgi:2-polyprenyl-3-methyl-5-hydroxy-6-metoxy-1,4-benzoquinol methylase
MKKKSEFSSKKVSELKVKNKKKSEKVIQPKKNNDFFGNQEIKQDLQSFYNTEAKKYAETRKKFWHEEKAILDAITPLFLDISQISPNPSLSRGENNEFPLDKGGRGEAEGDLQNKKIRVLEFGCGSGRFATLLNQNFPGQFDYVGIDLSDELLSYASTQNPNLTFFQ